LVPSLAREHAKIAARAGQIEHVDLLVRSRSALVVSGPGIAAGAAGDDASF